MPRWTPLLLFSLVLPSPGFAQDTTAARQVLPPRPSPLVTMSLQESLDEARGHSPAYRQIANDAGPAKWAVRNAWSSLVLPQWDVSGTMSYTGVGESQFGGGLTNRSPSFLTSRYGMTLSWGLTGRTVLGPSVEKANARAVDADIANAEVTLLGDVTDQYLVALQATAQVDVARQQVERNQIFLDLAQARFRLGQATLLDVRQAEATKAQSQSQWLVAVQAENTAKLELFRRMGITPPVEVQRVALTDPFAVTEPNFDLELLVGQAGRENPTLNATRAREDAARWNLRAVKTDYLPSISASASWGGFAQEFTNKDLLLAASLDELQRDLTSCQRQNAINAGASPVLPPVSGCTEADKGLMNNATELTPATRDAILEGNNVFPFDFTSSPFFAQVRVSLPLFTGFGRTLATSRAAAAREDAEETVRATELQVRAQVTQRYLEVQTAYQAIGIEDASRAAAREQLRLAQDRYRLGSGNATELTDAQTAVTLAEVNYVNAVYAYHRALTALEVAVGRPLR